MPYISSIAEASPDWIRFTRRDQDCPAGGTPACTDVSESDSCAFVMSLQPRQVLYGQAGALRDQWRRPKFGGSAASAAEKCHFGNILLEIYQLRILPALPGQSIPPKRGWCSITHVGIEPCLRSTRTLIYENTLPPNCFQDKILPRGRNLPRCNAPHTDSMALPHGIRSAIGTNSMLDRLGGQLERYMDLLSARQKLVASNIANADTPGYHTRDIDFQSEFQSSLGGAPQTVEVTGLRMKNDGNNVDLDRESRLLAENALRFSVASSLMKSQIQTVRSAIKEGQSA